MKVKRSAAFILTNDSKKGRCVCASQRYSAGQSVDLSPLLVIPKYQSKAVEDSIIDKYAFLFEAKKGRTQYCIALGIASLCNHSFDPSCIFLVSVSDLTIQLIARKPIQIGEEITINYQYGNVDRYDFLLSQNSAPRPAATARPRRQ